MAPPTLKRLTLELGGNDAAIVMPDFDVETGAEGLFWSTFSNCGQVCAAAKRIFVPDALDDSVASAFADIAGKVKIGPWDADDVEMDPMQNQSQQAKVADLVGRAMAAGAEVLFESAVPHGLGASVWTNQHPSMGPEIPFGGVKASGIGVEYGVKGLEEYTLPFVLNVKKA